jgi:gamma-glutamyltranspeptidase/glutathione hydrolase
MPAARRWLYLLPLASCLALAGAGVRTAWRGIDREKVPAQPHFDRYAVATENATATRVGIEALRSGANAVDTAITIALTLGVVQPASSGIGGGGFALVWDAAQRKVTALDFREVAPGGIDPAELEYRPKEVVKSGRGRMIGVPGEIAGLVELHRRFGKRSFAEDVAPAVAVAEQGYATSDHLARLAVAYHAQINFSSQLKALFKPNGYAVGVGRRIVNRDLAATLRRIGDEGSKAFYEGEVAAEIVKAAQATGSPLTLRDLRAYRAVEREPLKIGWEGHTIYTMPPPSAGGLLLAETLGMFGKADLEPLGFGSGAYNHLLAETFRSAIVDRMRAIGDPGFVKTDVQALVAQGRLQDRRAAIARDRTRAMPKFPLREHGTAHFVVVDAEGNVVSLTTTINDAFGSMVSTETTGIILNDELDDFTTKAASAMFQSSVARSAESMLDLAGAVAPAASKVPAASTDVFGPNEPRPFARPTSSMTPTLAFRDGLPVLAVGGSGGLRIATGVTQALLARMVFQLPVTDCVAVPRVHTPTDETSPVIEIDESVAEAVVSDMKSRGETVRIGPNYSAVQMVAIDRGASGATRISAASDPRKGGTALVE